MDKCMDVKKEEKRANRQNTLKNVCQKIARGEWLSSEHDMDFPPDVIEWINTRKEEMNKEKAFDGKCYVQNI